MAWVLAFPTLFPPVFEDNKWKINGDFTLKQDGQLKEKDVLFSEWAEWILWSNNGRHAGHPTFSLVLNSELTRSGLLKQGRVTLSKHDIPSNITIDDFKKHWKTDKGRKKFHKSLNYHIGNITGTDQYGGTKNWQFRNIAHHLSYKEHLPLRMFATSSLAEYHDVF